MSDHYRTLSAIFPVLLRDEDGQCEVLLHRRQNTGYKDGQWDIAGSGHVDEGETARSAVTRECKEELGITVDACDLAFAHLSHRFSQDRVYYDLYFVVKRFSGTPAIMEPDKCAELKWFAVNNLPPDIIECRREDLGHILNGVFYSETLER